MVQEAKQFAEMEMLKKDINFADLYKLMVEHGYDYTLDDIHQKVGRGTYDVRFQFAFLDSLGLNVSLVPKMKPGKRM